MPFKGSVNRFGYPDVAPGSHPVYNGGGWGDWSTDIYAPERTAVRPRIYGPAAGYALKVSGVYQGCAGKQVTVSSYRGSSKVGQVSFSHLAEVPAFSIGQQITTGTVVGRLKLWPRCRTWKVDNADGVHTHIEVGTEPGKACYMPGMSKKAYADTRMIGIITPGATASCS
jgi:hypothetical protein